MVSPQQDAKRTRVNDPEPMGTIPKFVESPSPHVVGNFTHVSDSVTSQAPTDPPSTPPQTDDGGDHTLGDSTAMEISDGDQTEQDNKTGHGPRAMEIDSMDHTATAEEQVEEKVEEEQEEEAEDIPKENPVTFPEISSTNGLNIESLVSFFLFL